ncbi:MAG: class I SAM-dependent methyltransferase [Phycisphaerales bacterium]|nr:MAG: class I SAM-dependent methyltransferase [Phycisphaerales bacterium]
MPARSPLNAEAAKSLYKRVVRKLMRAGLADVEAHLQTIDQALAADADRVAVWRGSLADGAAVLEDGREPAELTRKYRSELAFWVNVVKNTERVPGFEGEFEATFGGWQRDRLNELGRFLELPEGLALCEWCAERVAVEIGAGPYPMLAVATWKAAVAVDPLADGYLAEDLLPKRAHADRLIYLAAPGERVPLPAGSADLVVIENCLDHVSDPARVMREVRRLLKPGGLCWILVDLMDYRDEMHPHAFNEARLRALLAEAGFETLRDRVSDHKSHPEAYGELRALLRKPIVCTTGEAAPVVEPRPVAQHAKPAGV